MFCRCTAALALGLVALSTLHAAPPAAEPKILVGMKMTGLAPSKLVPDLCLLRYRISTTSPKCQAFFDQALGYFYSYVWMEAARSFETALQYDPRGFTTQGGWTVGFIRLTIIPMSGGLTSATKAPVNAACGTWGPVTVNNLDKGQYAVFANMQLLGPCCNQKVNYIISAISTVTVNVKGGNPRVPPGTVSYAAGDPTIAQGSVSTSKNGTYNITACGYTATACSLLAYPSLGGDITNPLVQVGPAPACGNWGPITVKGLKTGQYLVVGWVTMKSAGGPRPQVQTPVSILSVP
jgi:hypothetical protein